MKHNPIIVGLVLLAAAAAVKLPAQAQDAPPVSDRPVTGSRVPRYEMSQNDRALSIAALNKLPPDTIRVAQVKEKLSTGDALLLPDIIILALALSRYDTAETLELMHKVAP
jgi:hypothetical protein